MSAKDPGSTLMTKNPRVGSGNFLADQGYQDPEEARIKFLIANEIALAIEDLRLTQVAAAEKTGLRQPDISRIVNGNVADYSVWRLIKVLSSLGKDISIEIRSSVKARGDIFAVSFDQAGG